MGQSIASERGPKICRLCGQGKPRAQFSPNPEMRDGLRSECKPCLAERARKRYAKAAGRAAAIARVKRYRHTPKGRKSALAAHQRYVSSEPYLSTRSAQEWPDSTK